MSRDNLRERERERSFVREYGSKLQHSVDECGTVYGVRQLPPRADYASTFLLAATRRGIV